MKLITVVDKIKQFLSGYSRYVKVNSTTQRFGESKNFTIIKCQLINAFLNE